MTAVAVPARAGVRARAWARSLPERHGSWLVVAALGAIALLALVLRVRSAYDPLPERPGSDPAIYAEIARNLFRTGHWGLSSWDWSPGAPLAYGAVYKLVGQADPLYARLFVALLGTLTTLPVYLLGRRLGGPLAGLAGALLWALYPVAIYFTGELMSEPLAELTLPLAVLAFLRAGERPRRAWEWAVPGFLLGCTAFVRPEYLAFSAVFALLALLRVRHLRGAWRPGVAAAAALVLAFLVPVAPWSAYVSHRVGRFVPVTTGGGKALFIGTYLPGNGLHLDVKRELIRRFQGRTNLSATALSETSMTPLLNRVARRYPHLPRDAALQRIGRENAIHYATTRPLAFAGMILGKIRHMWEGSGADGRSTYGSIYQYALLALAAAALVLLALRRRWEVLLPAALLLGVSLLGGLLLAGTRRNLALMPIVIALAGAGLAFAARALVERRSGPGRERASRYLAPPCES